MKKDDAREERIETEIVVDAYDSHECAMGWYCYLEDKLDFPFSARIVSKRTLSRNKENEIVNVIGMSDSDDCLGGMWVVVETDNDEYDVPLEQIYPLQPETLDEITVQSIDDWRYWVEQGYSF